MLTESETKKKMPLLLRFIRKTLVSSFTLDQLQTFVLALDLGSFSAAAKQLDVSQPAVSLQVRELERRLESRLIERVGRRLTPTAAGTTLLGYARSILELSVQAADATRSLSDGVQGSVRLGAGATACLHLLPPLLGKLRKEYPALQVSVTTGNMEEVVRKVEQNALDFALVTLPASGRALAITPVMLDPFVMIGASTGRPLPARITPVQASSLPMILFEAGTNTRRQVDEWLRTSGIQVRPVMELGDVEAIKEMVSAGLGYSIVPGMAIRRSEMRSIQMRSLHPRASRKLGLVIRHDKPLTRGMQIVVSALKQAGAKHRPIKAA